MLTTKAPPGAFSRTDLRTRYRKPPLARWKVKGVIPPSDTADFYEAAMLDAVQNGTTEFRPRETATTDRATTVTPAMSGVKVIGHPRGTTFFNADPAGDGYPGNNSFAAYGSGMGYVDGFVRTPEGHAVVDPAVLPNYLVGRSVHAFLYDGYLPGMPGQNCKRLTVVGHDGNAVVFSEPVPENTNALKWYALAPWAGRAAEGMKQLRVASTAGLSVGTMVYVTGGPCVANATEGEYRTIAEVWPTSVTLDRPLRMDHPQPVVAVLNVVGSLAVRDCEFRQPLNVGPNPTAAFFSQCHNLRLEGCKSDGNVSIVASGRVTLVDCRFAQLSLNNVTECLILGGEYGTVWMEEACCDVHLTRTHLWTPGGTASGVNTDGITGTRDVRVQGCTFDGIGAIDWTGHPAMPLHLGGPNMSVVGSRFVGSRPGATSYVGGPNGRLQDCNTDSQIVVIGSADWLISGNRGPVTLQ